MAASTFKTSCRGRFRLRLMLLLELLPLLDDIIATMMVCNICGGGHVKQGWFVDSSEVDWNLLFLWVMEKVLVDWSVLVKGVE